MPEEINRIVMDSIADVLSVSDPDGLIHLSRECHPKEQTRSVGNIMMDTLYGELPAAEKSGILIELGLNERNYIYLTLHRPSNVDDPDVLKKLIDVLVDISREIAVVFAIHPQTRASLDAAGIELSTAPGIKVIQPLGYRHNLRMIQCAKAVFTDSVGIQEESSALNVPCLTLRYNTEPSVTVQLGSSEFVGNDPFRIRNGWNAIKNGNWKQSSQITLWAGHAAERILSGLREVWGS